MIRHNVEQNAIYVVVTQNVGHAYAVDRLSLACWYFYILYIIDDQEIAYWILGMQ